MSATSYTLHGRHHARLPEDEPDWDAIFGRVDAELAGQRARRHERALSARASVRAQVQARWGVDLADRLQEGLADTIPPPD